MQQITAVQLNQRLQSEGPHPLLLDVRELHEFAHCHIAGSINIPMNQVFSRLSQLDSRRETVVICHHGMRSAQIANLLTNNGFERIINLQGGVDAWASAVDPSMPRY